MLFISNKPSRKQQRQNHQKWLKSNKSIVWEVAAESKRFPRLASVDVAVPAANHCPVDIGPWPYGATPCGAVLHPAVLTGQRAVGREGQRGGKPAGVPAQWLQSSRQGGEDSWNAFSTATAA